jgi:hemerythrin-like domain-containing protein
MDAPEQAIDLGFGFEQLKHAIGSNDQSESLAQGKMGDITLLRPRFARRYRCVLQLLEAAREHGLGVIDTMCRRADVVSQSGVHILAHPAWYTRLALGSNIRLRGVSLTLIITGDSGIQAVRRGKHAQLCTASEWHRACSIERISKLTTRSLLALRARRLHIDISKENVMQNDDTTRYHSLVQPADAIEMLKADHRRVRALLQRYDGTDDQVIKQGIVAELFVELELHTQLEETVFYPAFADETNREGQELVDASLEAHEEIDVLVEELRGLETDPEAFAAKFQELRTKVEQHVQDEESQMFPQAEQALAEQLEELRDEMQEIKDQLLA